jgi:plasmid replication initiation protein
MSRFPTNELFPVRRTSECRSLTVLSAFNPTHTKQTLYEWFETEYRLALKATGIWYRKYIHNINEKGAIIYMPIREEVVVPIRIKEMYTEILKNRISLTIIKCISVDSKAIPPIVIVLSVMIIVS